MKKKLFILLIIFLIPISTMAEIANEARLYYNKGVDYYKLGQYEKAAKYFRGAIDVSPEYIDAYYNLGSIYEFLEQYPAALAVFEQIVVRKIDDYEAIYKAANIAYKLGQYDKALRYTANIPKSSNQYDLAKTLARKIKAVNLIDSNVNIPLNQSEQLSVTSSQLFEGIQGPTGMVTDDSANLYVASFSDNSVIKISPDGRRVLYARDKKINGPIGLAIDVLGNLYIANYNDNNILKISKNGTITVLIGNINKPYGLYLKGNMLFISSQGSNSVFRYKLNN